MTPFPQLNVYKDEIKESKIINNLMCLSSSHCKCQRLCTSLRIIQFSYPNSESLWSMPPSFNSTHFKNPSTDFNHTQLLITERFVVHCPHFIVAYRHEIIWADTHMVDWQSMYDVLKTVAIWMVTFNNSLLFRRRNCAFFSSNSILQVDMDKWTALSCHT